MKKVSDTKKILFYALLSFGLIIGIYFLSANRNIEASIYFWESGREKLSENETKFLSKNNVKRLYVKLFEIDYSKEKGAFPISPTSLKIAKTPSEIVPVIFIRNSVFRKEAKVDEAKLIKNLLQKITFDLKSNFPSQAIYKELQIDCDWTLSTKNKYHRFLRKLKKQLGEKSNNPILSATLRLYPYKFQKEMGVLPVDKVVLMCYNLIPPSEAQNRNAILDLNELKKYLIGAQKYPVDLNIALPVFSQVRWYKKNHLEGIFPLEIAKLKKHLRILRPSWFMVKHSFEYQGIYLKRGDVLKLDKLDLDRIKKALKLIKDKVDLPKNFELILFHLNNKQIQHFYEKDIRIIYHYFQHSEST